MAGLLRKFILYLCLCHASVSTAWASADVCGDPDPFSHLSLALNNQDDSAIDQVPAFVGLENRDSDLQFKTANDRLWFGIGHRYSIFDVEPLQPATNGHLHTYFLPLHIVTGKDGRGFRVSVAPGLSLSSNVGDELGDHKDDAFQVLAALVWNKRLSERTSLQYGVCGDHRFGDYQVYPSVSAQWQIHPDWNVQLGFPASSIRYQVSPNFASTIRIAPDGNEWFVLDRSQSFGSQFIHEAWAIDWTFDWALQDGFVFTASVGRQFDNRFEMTLLDQSRVRLSGDPVTRIGAALEWRF